MDPVSVFNALYDTKCLKFGQFQLKSGLVAPYYINLRRLPLFPKLMDAIIGQAIERHLTGGALELRRKGSCRQVQCSEMRADSGVCVDEHSKRMANKLADKCNAHGADDSDADADSQLGDEDSASESGDCPPEPFQPIICGVPYGALPLATAIAYKAQLPFLFERKRPKAYGDHQPLLDGSLGDTTTTTDKPSEQRVVLVEDVICSGASVLECVRSLERMKLKVEFVICIIDREENGINLLLEQAGIKVFSLYNMSAILRILEVTGRISRQQYMSTRQWMAQSQFQTIGVDPSAAIKASEAKRAPQMLTNQTPVHTA